MDGKDLLDVPFPGGYCNAYLKVNSVTGGLIYIEHCLRNKCSDPADNTTPVTTPEPVPTPVTTPESVPFNLEACRYEAG